MPILPYKFIHPVFLFSPPDKGSTFKFIKKYLKGYERWKLAYVEMNY